MKNKIFGFSLAEMMIVLLMIAISLAATAPMITKRVSTNKSDRVFVPVSNPNWAQHIVYYEKGIGTGNNKQKIFLINNPAIGGMGITTNNISSLLRYSILFGNTQPANYAVALGYNVTAAEGSVALGSGVTAGEHTVTIGNGTVGGNAAYAQQYGNVAIGFNAHSTGSSGALAIGYNSTTEGNNGATAIGINSQGKGNYSTAIGNDAQATQHAASALGVSSRATSSYTTAMGHDARATGYYSSALGVASRADYSSASVGASAQATGSYASALGASTTANGSISTAIGQGSTASGYYSSTLGPNAKAWHYNSMAIGQGAQTDRSNEIVIGTSSQIVEIPGTLEITSLTLPGNLLVKGNVAFGANAGHNIYMRENTVAGNGNGQWWNKRRRLVRAEGTAATFETEDNQNEVRGIGENSTRSMVYGLASDGSIWINNERISDKRLKNVGEKYTYGLDALRQLDFYHYTFKNDKTKTPYVGVMAQDLQKVFPESVSTNEKSGYLQIRWDEMFYATINAVKELDTKLIELATKVEDMIKDIVDMKTTIAQQQQTIDTQHQQIKDIQQQISELAIRADKLEKR